MARHPRRIGRINIYRYRWVIGIIVIFTYFLSFPALEWSSLNSVLVAASALVSISWKPFVLTIQLNALISRECCAASIMVARFIVNQRHGRALHVRFSGSSTLIFVFSIWRGYKTGCFRHARKQAKGGFIKTYAIADQRHYAICQRKHQHDAGCRQQNEPTQRQRQKM